MYQLKCTTHSNLSGTRARVCKALCMRKRVRLSCFTKRKAYRTQERQRTCAYGTSKRILPGAYVRKENALTRHSWHQTYSTPHYQPSCNLAQRSDHPEQQYSQRVKIPMWLGQSPTDMKTRYDWGKAPPRSCATTKNSCCAPSRKRCIRKCWYHPDESQLKFISLHGDCRCDRRVQHAKIVEWHEVQPLTILDMPCSGSATTEKQADAIRIQMKDQFINPGHASESVIAKVDFCAIDQSAFIYRRTLQKYSCKRSTEAYGIALANIALYYTFLEDGFQSLESLAVINACQTCQH